MEPYRDDQDLIVELRAQRPVPDPEFAAELDERAATGFPRRSLLLRSPFGRLFARPRALPPRRLAFSAGAAALAAVAIATVVVAASEPESDRDSIAQVNAGERSTPLSRPASPPSKPSRETKQLKPSPELKQFSEGVSSSAGVGRNTELSRALKNHNLASDSSGPYASQARQRDVERSAEMVLGADPDDVAGDAAEVFDAVHAANGIVLSSSVNGGAEGDAGARFDLLIPTAKLSDALADFSAIGTVVSRHEATADITAPTVQVGEHLRDSRATIDGLLVQLAGADSDAERAEVEAELRAERRHAAALRAQATKLDRRANLSRVSLRIETGAGAISNDEGDWGIGDALGDAGHILAIAAGVTIVGLAIFTPLALIALLAWLANRARLRRARERALV